MIWYDMMWFTIVSKNWKQRSRYSQVWMSFVICIQSLCVAVQTMCWGSSCAIHPPVCRHPWRVTSQHFRQVTSKEPLPVECQYYDWSWPIHWEPGDIGTPPSESHLFSHDVATFSVVLSWFFFLVCGFMRVFCSVFPFFPHVSPEIHGLTMVAAKPPGRQLPRLQSAAAEGSVECPSHRARCRCHGMPWGPCDIH